MTIGHSLTLIERNPQNLIHQGTVKIMRTRNKVIYANTGTELNQAESPKNYDLLATKICL
ncbi:unnamed protein product [Ceratitis capitata]|uniref:(Mediterranean fruit fly) hypothetical protein n=1 Tax=Ceratitis capitata TaxID=7213 RepID=A0A811U8S4_CERCA|nr:unnamed protein product [Ceratitis capitata]